LISVRGISEVSCMWTPNVTDITNQQKQCQNVLGSALTSSPETPLFRCFKIFDIISTWAHAMGIRWMGGKYYVVGPAQCTLFISLTNDSNVTTYA
jgi:hypothetical protein